jgi:transposase-like protein
MANSSNHRKPYPEEFRREAVALYRRGGATLKEVAADLGVSVESLRIWVNQDAVDKREQPGLSTDEKAELRELRRKVRRLQQEREILKKAAAFFAQESETR